MDSYPQSEDFEAWLAEVDLANEALRKLNSGEMTVEEFDYREKRRIEWQEREKQAKLQKEKEKEEQIRMGHPGKGQGSNYKSFCKHCFTEFTISIEKCSRCGKNTMTCEERRAELQQKVQEFKEKKARKLERKHKWEMWQKSKGLVWKKTSTNYTKWDYFTSSEEEDNEDDKKEPILPRNDPNFQALERDLEQRAYKRKLDYQKAEELKEKGNELLKKSEFQLAIYKYNEALELVRDFKAVYTNRALAYIKLGKFSKAIDDCNKVLEIAEVFEKGYEKSSNLCLKALLRRALCLKEKGQWDLALQDLEAAEKLKPNDKEILELRKTINFAKNHVEKAKELLKQEKKNKNIKRIDEFLEEKAPKRVDFDEVCKTLAKNVDLKAYFYEKKGLEHAVKLMTNGNIDGFLLLNIFLDDNAYYQETFVQKHQGLELLLKQFTQILAEAREKDARLFDNIEELLELLVTLSQNEKTRVMMKENSSCFNLYKEFFPIYLEKYNQEHKSLGSYFSLLGNLCFGAGNSLIKQAICQETSDFIVKIQPIFMNNAKYLAPLKESICNLLVNICNDAKIREIFSSNEEFLRTLSEELKSINIVKDHRFLGYLQALLGVLCNICFQASPTALNYIETLDLPKSLHIFLKELDKNNENFKEIYSRSLNILSRLSYSDPFVFPFELMQEFFFTNRLYDSKSKEFGYTNHALRVLGRIFQCISKKKELLFEVKEKCKPDQGLIQGLLEVIGEDHEQRFCNATVVAGDLVEIYGGLHEWKGVLARLINVVKEKVNLMRKNAAIFLAKLAKNQENLEVIRSLHGIEVLQSVANIILNK